MRAALLGVAVIMILILLAEVSIFERDQSDTSYSHLLIRDSINHENSNRDLDDIIQPIFQPANPFYFYDKKDDRLVEGDISPTSQFSPIAELGFVTNVIFPEIKNEQRDQNAEREGIRLLDLTLNREMAVAANATLDDEATDEERIESDPSSRDTEGETEDKNAAEVEIADENADDMDNQEEDAAPSEDIDVDIVDQVRDKDTALDVEAFIQEAKVHEGTPFVFGGSTPNGFDCSGFIYYVLNQVGYEMNRLSSIGYYEATEPIDQPQIGDFIFFAGTYRSGISHLGILINDEEFIHAGSKGVEISSLEEDYWHNHFVEYRTLR